MKAGLSFGAFASKIRDQLREQGLVLHGSRVADVNHLQTDAEYVNRLRIRGVLTTGEAEKANKRILKRVLECVDVEASVSSNGTDGE